MEGVLLGRTLRDLSIPRGILMVKILAVPLTFACPLTVVEGNKE